jgi:hypothetical protein
MEVPARDSAQPSADDLARALESYLAEHPLAVVLEDGKALFHMSAAKYALDVKGDGRQSRCVLQFWSEERNIVRRVTGMRARKQSLLLETARLGQAKPGMLEITDAETRRAPTEKKMDRARYLRVLERTVARHLGDWKLGTLKATTDLEHSFGPAHVRGELTRGNSSMALLAVGSCETPETVDAALTAGILWLALLRERASARKLVEGLRLIVPAGMVATTASRFAWMDPAQAKWELWQFDETLEELTQVEADAGGNLATRLLQAPQEERVKERFAVEIAQIREIVPECEVRVAGIADVAFALHGLVFARARMDAEAATFARSKKVAFGAGANETELTDQTEPLFRSLLERLRASRIPDGSAGDPLYRMQAEAWLESRVRLDVSLVSSELEPQPVYSQRSAFAGASERGVPDLIVRTRGGRLAVIELKAHEDMQMAMQGLDYWMRVRHLHLSGESATGAQSEFIRMGYFPGLNLTREDPLLLLVAPALWIHPAVEVVLRYLSPRVPWQLLAVDERWRSEVRVIWRKRSGELAC